ncbi:MAG: transcriptional regulator [Magnetospirillum sp.]|nr:transcriptional regulator [Magnetospirillum sp.]
MDAATPKPPRRGRQRIASQDGQEPVDMPVGRRMRRRRPLPGPLQREPGKAVGLAFRQIRKYGRGAGRVSASMLHRLGQALDVPESFFFDDMPEDMALRPSRDREDASTKRELPRHDDRIPDAPRKWVDEPVKAMGRAGS